MGNQKDVIELDNAIRKDYRDTQYWQSNCALCGRKRTDCQDIVDNARSQGIYTLCCELPNN